MAELAGIDVGIVGVGAIGGALIERLLDGSVRPSDIVACEQKEARRDEVGKRFGVRITDDPRAAAHCGIIVLAVPPLEVRKVLAAIGKELSDRSLVISFAGAVPLATLEAALPASVPVVRVNPNSPLLVGAGYNPVVYGSSLTDAKRNLADRFLALLGDNPVVADQDMNLYTAITAVGPTYFLPVFDALISAGLAGGLARDAAVTAALATARGSIEMIAKRPEAPDQLKYFTGLRPLDDALVRDLIGQAISTALSRMNSVQEQAAL
jgi:pyrroline-5-carboxylate reductase